MRAAVGDEEADAEPGGLLDLGRQVVPALFPVDPFPAEPHQDEPGQAHEQEREVAEPEQARLAARQRQRSRAREESAEDDGRADDMQEQREVLIVGPDCG